MLKQLRTFYNVINFNLGKSTPQYSRGELDHEEIILTKTSLHSMTL